MTNWTLIIFGSLPKSLVTKISYYQSVPLPRLFTKKTVVLPKCPLPKRHGTIENV